MADQHGDRGDACPRGFSSLDPLRTRTQTYVHIFSLRAVLLVFVKPYLSQDELGGLSVPSALRLQEGEGGGHRPARRGRAAGH